MVRSNVTGRVRLLERELGVPLFYRHSRGVTLTGTETTLIADILEYRLEGAFVAGPVGIRPWSRSRS